MKVPEGDVIQTIQAMAPIKVKLTGWLQGNGLEVEQRPEVVLSEGYACFLHGT